MRKLVRNDYAFVFFQLDSLEKLNELLDACSRVGVQTNPMVIDGLGIIPLFSWYHEVNAFSFLYSASESNPEITYTLTKLFILLNKYLNRLAYSPEL